MSRIQLVSLRRSWLPSKKYAAKFSNGVTTHFGAAGYGDFIIHSRTSPTRAKEKRRQYIARHAAQESWTDPTSAGTLARYILWEKPTLGESVKAFKRRFRV